MAEVWQTIEQAAVTLGLSVRTVNRHITGGKLQSRLFEGRREVLVSLPDPVRSSVTVKPSAGGEPAQSPIGSGSNVNFTMGASTSPSAASVDAASASASSASATGPTFDSVRRAMSADYADENPLDLRTMLTLADSADDKASLAVAAYQTLARSSEIQVQSLRRVALGAWASVGVLAAGAIVAVGWGTYRLTSSEGTSAYLRTQVTEQKGEINQLTVERDQVKNDLIKMQIETARLQDRVAQSTDTQSVAELARYALRAVKQSEAAGPSAVPDTQPAPTPSTQSAVAEAPATRPTTLPTAVAIGTGGPATQPTSKPAITGQRPTFITNSREPFDPR